MTSKTENGKGGPVFNEEEHERKRNSAMDFKAKPDDIYICAYPKAGTHWTFEVVRFLLAGSTDIPVEDKDDVMFGMAETEQIEALPSPRNINTHFLFGDLSADILEKKCKIIYITRDPRDIVVSSLYHRRQRHADEEWNEHFQNFVDGKALWKRTKSNSKWDNSWFGYTKGWEEGMRTHPEIPFLVLAYESLKKDPSKEAKRIVEFLGVECNEELLQKVLEKTNIDVMKAARPEDKQYFFRKGVTGDWKNHFTVAQSELFNQVFEEKMAGTDAYKLYSHTLQE